MRHRLSFLGTFTLAFLLITACGGGGSGGGDPGSCEVPSPSTEGDPIPASSFTYNLNAINTERLNAGLGLLALVEDPALTAFAMNGSRRLLTDHTPHNHFILCNGSCSAAGFGTACAENQGDPNGWTIASTNTQIQQIIDMMMAEGPGGGHHDNILDARWTKVGIGLVQDTDGRLYLTNDFSN